MPENTKKTSESGFTFTFNPSCIIGYKAETVPEADMFDRTYISLDKVKAITKFAIKAGLITLEELE